MKTVVAMAIGALLFGGGLIGGLLVQNYLSGQQSGSSGFEQLTFVNWVSRPFTKLGMEFTLRNSGTRNLQIMSVMLNGFLNQSYSGNSEGWMGTTILVPNQTGTMYVFYPSYQQAFNDSMPKMSNTPTQSELSNFEQWTSSFNCTFTFVTDTDHSYNLTLSRLGYDLYTALWESSSTYYFTSTEQVSITNLTFQTGTNGNINVTASNTGTTPVTINEVWVNNVRQSSVSPTLPNTITANNQKMFTVSISISAGYSYQVKLVSSKGNAFISTGTSPS